MAWAKIFVEIKGRDTEGIGRRAIDIAFVVTSSNVPSRGYERMFFARQAAQAAHPERPSRCRSDDPGRGRIGQIKTT
jgi:hypothetical protein